MRAVWDWKAHFGEINEKKVFDCYIAEALLSEGRYMPTEEKAFKDYHVDTLEDLAEKQQVKLSKLLNLERLYYDVEMPLVSILHEMEKQGIILNTVKLADIGKQIQKEAEALQQDILIDIGFNINLNSSQQVGEYLAEKEGVPLGRTKTGKYATNEGELLKYQEQNVIIKKILQYRTLSKLYSTYIQSLIDKADDSQRVHTTYHQVLVNTGRLASSNPNLQNIPVTSEYGTKIKSCFIPSPGFQLISFDYSQQELRIMAHLSGEPKLLEAFQENRDVHKITAGQLFGVEHDHVTAEQRRIGKTINFGIIYGMSGYGMSESLNIDVATGEEFIQNFYKTFPRIKEYYDTFLRDAKLHGFVETILGRRRYVFDNPDRKFIDNPTRRVLMNYPIQGSAADLMKLAMIKLHREILQNKNDIRLLLQIHDDLVFEIRKGANFAKYIAVIKEIMCKVYPFSVPMEVDVKIGDTWGDMKPVQ